MNLSEAKRAWLITDTHLGVRNSSQEWLQIMKEFFYDFFIPLVKKEKKPGDILIHCGDVFDSRHSLNLFVLNEAIQIFEDLSKISFAFALARQGTQYSWSLILKKLTFFNAYLIS